MRYVAYRTTKVPAGIVEQTISDHSVRTPQCPLNARSVTNHPRFRQPKKESEIVGIVLEPKRKWKTLCITNADPDTEISVYVEIFIALIRCTSNYLTLHCSDLAVFSCTLIRTLVLMKINFLLLLF